MSYPTAANTGVPAGVVLTPSGDIVVTKAGTVLKNLDVKGQIWIQADNVTVENCKITSGNYYGVRIDKGVVGAVVQHCEIDGQGRVLNGIGGAGTFIGNDIHGCENGINWEGSVGGKILGNYIHDFRAPAGAHFDGIQLFGDDGVMKDIEIAGNTIINNGSPGGVSAIFVANTFGAVNNINIHDNYLGGGGFPIYHIGTYSSAPITGVVWANNYVAKGGYDYEYIRADAQGHWPTMSGNVETANPLPPETAPWLGSTPAPTPDPTPTPVPEPIPVPTQEPGHIYGTDGNDTWLGGTAGEFYHGGKGNDIINGRGGSDTLWGDEGRDIFQFTDKWSAYGDKVMDFTRGEDKLDFRGIDANPSKRGDQAFTWDGMKAASYSGANGHMWAVKDSASGLTHVYLKTENSVSFIDLKGLYALTASDFLL